MAVSDYSTTPGNNASISGTNIAEGCSPAGINNAIRQMMADIKVFADGLTIGSDIQAYDAGLASIAGLTTAADKMIYATASDTYATADLTSYGRQITALADGPAALTLFGAQASDATLTSLSGLSLVAGDIIYATGADTFVRLAKGTAGQVLVMNSGATAPAWSGSAPGDAPFYGCRAWVNFNGTGTVAIRASGNVSSITDNGLGDYTVNFTTAMPDADYAAIPMANRGGGTASTDFTCWSFATGSVRVSATLGDSNTQTDPVIVCVAIFR